MVFTLTVSCVACAFICHIFRYAASVDDIWEEEEHYKDQLREHLLCAEALGYFFSLPAVLCLMLLNIESVQNILNSVASLASLSFNVIYNSREYHCL